MNGVLIGKEPSLFTCEEIADEAWITVRETGMMRKWKDILAIHY